MVVGVDVAVFNQVSHRAERRDALIAQPLRLEVGLVQDDDREAKQRRQPGGDRPDDGEQDAEEFDAEVLEKDALVVGQVGDLERPPIEAR